MVRMGTILNSLKRIRLKYMGSWLKDQLSRPEWFRNLIVNRSAWGAFSIYAHIRRSDSKAKRAYVSKANAEKAAFEMSMKYGYSFVVYKCLFCEGWHISKTTERDVHGKTTKEIASQTYIVPVNMELNRKRLEKIVDKWLRPVLGGVMGDFPEMDGISTKLSKFRSLGVKTIIDVRVSVQNPEELSEICRRYGVKYFYYSFEGGQEGFLSANDDTVRLFPRLCQLIEAGGYYLCGRGEAILALMLYWVYFGADKGLNFCQIIKTKEEDYDCNCLPYYDEAFLYGNFSRVTSGMQERFAEYGQMPLKREVLNLRERKIWTRPWWYGFSDKLEGNYSFLTISKGPRYGVYRVSIERDHLGWVEEPNREFDNWHYNYIYEGHELSGEVSSFEEARKVLFDYIYSHTTPEEYYKLMKLNG